MFFSKVASVLIVAAALGASAQDAPTLSECALGCLTKSLPSSKCEALTDIECICGSTEFQTAAATCLTTDCQPEDVTAAKAVQDAQCALVNGGNSTQSGDETATTAGGANATASNTATTTGSSSAAPTKPANTSAPPAPTDAPTGGALGLTTSAGFVGAALALVGAVAAL
ncbi:hypothetical protein BXZ70DRAFT_927731 [Cristinia sonorae]|uniref:CFEM domain-containing protein n=1 Tax=Cristinia sonorae TaxID=1940300 RepID=A0A8K0UTR1_9AGAR|nr:hypothetical protein BXZ70DRAFT_927731 [Cristinia sonorae]